MIRSIPNKQQQDLNIGSIRNILWLPMDYIDAFWIVTDPYKMVDLTLTDINTTATWKTVDFIKGTAKFERDWATGPDGIYHKQKLSFMVAKHYDERVQDFTDMQEREFCVVIIDENDRGLVIGEINLRGEKKGMTFHDNSTTAIEWMGRNEYPCWFYGECAARALPAFWETAPPVEPPHIPGAEPVLPPID